MKLYELITAGEATIYLDLTDISTFKVIDESAHLVLKNGEKLCVAMSSLVSAMAHSEVGLMSINREEVPAE